MDVAGEDEKFMEMDGTDHCTIMWMFLKWQNSTLKKLLKWYIYIMYILLCRRGGNSFFFYLSRLSGWGCGNSTYIRQMNKRKSLSSCAAGTCTMKSVCCHLQTVIVVLTLFMGFIRQEYWSDLPFPSPVDHILSELSTVTHPSWVALHSMAQGQESLACCGPWCCKESYKT